MMTPIDAFHTYHTALLVRRISRSRFMSQLPNSSLHTARVAATPPSNRLSHRQQCPQTHEAWRYDIPAQNILNNIMMSRRLPGWMRRRCLRSERSTQLQNHHANRHLQHPRTCWMEFSRLGRRHSGSSAERSHFIFSPA
jgi:hypothetical protein